MNSSTRSRASSAHAALENGFTRTAQRNLREIGRHIALHNPVRALSFVSELREAARGIALAPTIYPVVSGTSVRRRVFGNYLILFELSADTLVILDIRHGARDTPSPT